MLVHVGEDRTIEVDLRLATLLAGVAGAINAIGFQAAGMFSANMTGNLSALSDHLALGRWSTAAGFSVLIAAFVAGAFTSALLIEAGRRRDVRGIYAFSILLEGALLAVLAAADLILNRNELLIVGLSFLMGLQNAATTQISSARVRTTHVSGIATDIGIELAILLAGVRDSDQRSVVASRLRLHAMTFGAFLLAGIAGAVAYQWFGVPMLLSLALILIAISVPELRRARTARQT